VVSFFFVCVCDAYCNSLSLDDLKNENARSDEA